MTLLAVLRHAKSSWDDPSLKDFDRPLNERGRKAARQVGRELKQRRVRFDHVIASPALRVRETIDGVAKGYGDRWDVHFEPQIYEAGVEGLFRLVRSIPEHFHAPVLIGHNPTLQQLVLKLTRDDEKGLRGKVAAKYPTAALALIELPVVRWDEVQPESGTIVELILPRDL